MSAIADIVEKLDTNTTEVTETQIFKLLHADADGTGRPSLTTLYSDPTTTPSAGGNSNNRGGSSNRGGQPSQQQRAARRSERALLQARVIAVADPRTNSVLVNASHASMMQIALLIGRLDASDTQETAHLRPHPRARRPEQRRLHPQRHVQREQPAAVVHRARSPPTAGLHQPLRQRASPPKDSNSLGTRHCTGSSGNRSSSGLR